MGETIVPGISAGNFAGTGFSLFDLAGVFVAKRTTEILLMPYVGNSSWKSAGAKGIGALAIYAGSGMLPAGLPRHIGHIVAAGMAFDAVEDASIALLGPNPLAMLGGAPQSAANDGVQFIEA